MIYQSFEVSCLDRGNNGKRDRETQRRRNMYNDNVCTPECGGKRMSLPTSPTADGKKQAKTRRVAPLWRRRGSGATTGCPPPSPTVSPTFRRQTARTHSVSHATVRYTVHAHTPTRNERPGDGWSVGTHGVVNVSVANRACPPWKNNRILVRPCPLDYLDTQNAIKLSPPSNSGRKIWSRVWNVSCVVWRKNTRLWKRTISQRGGGGEGKERGGKRYLRNRRESYKWR